MWWGGVVRAHLPPAALSQQHACILLLLRPLYRPLPRAALLPGPLFPAPLPPQPLYLDLLAARLKDPWLSPSFGQWYRGETGVLTETSSVAPSQLQGGEETPQLPHLEPVGSPTAPNSYLVPRCSHNEHLCLGSQLPQRPDFGVCLWLTCDLKDQALPSLASSLALL